MIVGCLPPFKSLFTNRFSSAPHYHAETPNSRTVGSKPNRSSRHNSIPLNSLDDAYHVRAKGGLDRGYSDTESQEMIVRTNEEMGNLKMGSNEIKVERVFVSLQLGFLKYDDQALLHMPISSNSRTRLPWENDLFVQPQQVFFVSVCILPANTLVNPTNFI